MKYLIGALALIGLGSILTALIFYMRISSGPTGCALTGEAIRYAEPVSEAPAANRDLVIKFYTEVIIDGNLDRAGDYLRADYIQHNPAAGQGLDGFVTYFEGLHATLDKRHATSAGEITMAMAEGDLVTVHVTTVIGGKVSASFRAIDIFRVEDGMIAEHWDTIQACDARSSLLLAFAS